VEEILTTNFKFLNTTKETSKLASLPSVAIVDNNYNFFFKFDRWHVFRAWGRVGTTIGDTKLTKMDTKQEAIEDFVALYEEKTGNLWENRDNFEKQPGKLYPLDIDYGEVFSCVFLKLCNDINFFFKCDFHTYSLKQIHV
jgi:hypothetical protein